MLKVTYYPGCSLEGTARDYAESIHGVCDDLGILLQEVPDWNCCGATAAHSINHKASIELAARNLRQAAEVPNPDMVVPCPLCFNRLKTASWELRGEHRGNYSMGLSSATPKIWDLANFFATEEMLAKIAEGVKTPLDGLKVVCYYGCMASRPPKITEATDHENPQSMDKILKALGVETIDWAYKTDCCGAGLSLSRPDMHHKMVGRLYDMARRVGAQAIVVSCQMCQANLDMYQDKIEAEWGRDFGFPILYFTELVGLANGLPQAAKWFSRHFVDPAPLLLELGLMEARK